MSDKTLKMWWIIFADSCSGVKFRTVTTVTPDGMTKRKNNTQNNLPAKEEGK